MGSGLGTTVDRQDTFDRTGVTIQAQSSGFIPEVSQESGGENLIEDSQEIVIEEPEEGNDNDRIYRI